MPLAATSASVTILTRDYIESSRADNAADLLRTAPFLQVAQSGAPGGLTTVTIRGGKPNFTLVLMDGIPVNDITNLLGGSFDFSSLALDNIEQVEIVRGPLSSIYGSDATGGVINFISLRGSKNTSLDVSGELGSFLRRQAKAGVAGTWKALQYSAGGSWLDVGQQVENDAYALASLGFHGSLSLGQNRVLDFTERYMDHQSAGFPTGSGGPELALLRQAVSDHARELVLGASLKGQVRPWWIYSFDLDRMSRTEDNFTPPVFDKIPPTRKSLPSSISDSDFTRTHLGATSRFLLPGNFSLALGAGVRQENGNTLGFIANTIPNSFTIGRPSLLSTTELQYSSHKLTATVGLGFDKTEGYGEVTSPRLGVIWSPKESGPRIKSSWATGFKLPSFYALGNPLVGDPSLRPERSRSWDAGIEQPLLRNRLMVSATYFRNDFQDLVDFSAVTFHLLNRSQALTHGVEFGADYAVHRNVQFRLDFSYMAWTLQNTTEPLRDIPHGNGGVHFDWRVSSRLRARAETQWMGRRYDFEVPVPDETSVGGYSNTNFSANYDLSTKVSIYLRADNLLNSKYHEYIGFPNPGAVVRFGLVFRVLGK
jgi:outer membrane cobalamin receptor